MRYRVCHYYLKLFPFLPIKRGSVGLSAFLYEDVLLQTDIEKFGTPVV
jgi:hypothetical protein